MSDCKAQPELVETFISEKRKTYVRRPARQTEVASPTLHKKVEKLPFSLCRRTTDDVESLHKCSLCHSCVFVHLMAFDGCPWHVDALHLAWRGWSTQRSPRAHGESVSQFLNTKNCRCRKILSTSENGVTLIVYQKFTNLCMFSIMILAQCGFRTETIY